MWGGGGDSRSNRKDSVVKPFAQKSAAKRRDLRFGDRQDAQNPVLNTRGKNSREKVEKDGVRKRKVGVGEQEFSSNV